MARFFTRLLPAYPVIALLVAAFLPVLAHGAADPGVGRAAPLTLDSLDSPSQTRTVREEPDCGVRLISGEVVTHAEAPADPALHVTACVRLSFDVDETGQVTGVRILSEGLAETYRARAMALMARAKFSSLAGSAPRQGVEIALVLQPVYEKPGAPEASH